MTNKSRVTLVGLFGLACVLSVLAGEVNVTTPPKLRSTLSREIAYQPKYAVTLPCEAEGTQPISYLWKYNEAPLTIDGVHIRQLPGSGTLEINVPEAGNDDVDMDGIYQCFAYNQFGRAVSVKTTLRKAYINPFEVTPTKTRTVTVGQYHKLSCDPPDSYPKALVFWGTGMGSEYHFVPSSKRVALDYEGALHFINVLEEDASNGMPYTCATQNTVLRTLSQGDDTLLNVLAITGTPDARPPKLEWSSEQQVTAVEGAQVKMMCIFSGYPTPTVKWERTDGGSTQGINMGNKDGMEVFIPQAKPEHAGRYRCSASSNVGNSGDTRDFELRVEHRPRWENGEEPKDVTASDGEDAEIVCAAEGVPPPTITFSFDGNPTPKDSDTGQGKGRIEADRVIFTNLTKTDTKVIQCNASNVHGYIFSNVFLNILAEPPTFIEEPLAIVKRAEGQEVILTCRVFAAPKAKITWKRGNPPMEVVGPQYETLPDGDLRIKAAVHSDANIYHCHAENKFGHKSRSGQLLIRDSTKIDFYPKSKEVEANSDVMFFCNATTDPAEISKLKIQWLWNGEPIDYMKEGKISKNMQDNRLLITQALPEDSGSYTCVASNDIDEDRATAQLMVKDRPDPPQIHLDACTSSAAQVSWVPGNENNDEVIEFIVKYNTTFDPKHTYHIGAIVPKGTNSAQMSLSPWANYTFHVVARNSLGVSDKSPFTQASCEIPAKQPTYDPDWVCTSSEAPDKLVIRWQTFPPIMQNGSDFHYILKYRLADGNPLSPEVVANITDWRKGEHIVPNQPIYTKYEILVKTANEKGKSRARDRWVEGYSGEGVPEVTPANFDLDPNSVNDTHAKFYWDAVDTDMNLIKGHFKGYRIVYWKADDPDNKKSTEIIENEIPMCPPEGAGAQDAAAARYRRAVTKQGIVGDLWPYSDIQAAIQVMNGGNVGELSSPPISFRTLQGVPSAVMMFEIKEIGSHHMVVEWLPPVFANGILTKYEIGYEELEGSSGLQIAETVEIGTHRKKIHGLKERTLYQVFIWAYTEVGQGKPMMDEGRTKAAAPPDVPIVSIDDFQVGDDWVNVTWTPTEEPEPNNPGTYYYVEYKRPGSDEWERTPNEKEHNWYNVTDLEPGKTEIRVVAVNGNGEETKSPAVVVVVGPRDEGSVAAASSKGWFIALMIILLFLLLILIIICLIRRNRGGKYPVHEKEKLAGRDPDKEDEEAGFDEYTKGDEPEKKKSFTSLNSEERPLESDTDSMAEYYNTDPSKFNEDGSFIGQYGGKKKAEPDTTSPSALSTFV